MSLANNPMDANGYVGRRTDGLLTTIHDSVADEEVNRFFESESIVAQIVMRLVDVLNGRVVALGDLTLTRGSERL